MKLVHWIGKHNKRNFGDELNPWLWSRVLPGFFDDDDAELFLGIGSILFDSWPASSRKIVVGSGFAGYTAPPTIDDTWEVYFVRGKQTAIALGIDPRLGLGDPATLVPTVRDRSGDTRGSGGPAFMPHWESTLDGSWRSIAEDAGLTYIDPSGDVEVIMQKIASSSVLLTEAMHGAIVADALRVPWIPIAPSPIHLSKWQDWSQTLNVQIAFSKVPPSTWLELALRGKAAALVNRRGVRKLSRLARSAGSFAFHSQAVRALSVALRSRQYLSEDSQLARVTDNIMMRMDLVRTRSSREYSLVVP